MTPERLSRQFTPLAVRSIVMFGSDTWHGHILVPFPFNLSALRRSRGDRIFTVLKSRFGTAPMSTSCCLTWQSPMLTGGASWPSNLCLACSWPLELTNPKKVPRESNTL